MPVSAASLRSRQQKCPSFGWCSRWLERFRHCSEDDPPGVGSRLPTSPFETGTAAETFYQALIFWHFYAKNDNEKKGECFLTVCHHGFPCYFSFLLAAIFNMRVSRTLRLGFYIKNLEFSRENIFQYCKIGSNFGRYIFLKIQTWTISCSVCCILA